jgi:hypothetical protein
MRVLVVSHAMPTPTIGPPGTLLPRGSATCPIFTQYYSYAV